VNGDRRCQAISANPDAQPATTRIHGVNCCCFATLVSRVEIGLSFGPCLLSSSTGIQFFASFSRVLFAVRSSIQVRCAQVLTRDLLVPPVAPTRPRPSAPLPTPTMTRPSPPPLHQPLLRPAARSLPSSPVLMYPSRFPLPPSPCILPDSIFLRSRNAGFN
jgi:hypothetical protein